MRAFWDVQQGFTSVVDATISIGQTSHPPSKDHSSLNVIVFDTSRNRLAVDLKQTIIIE